MPQYLNTSRPVFFRRIGAYVLDIVLLFAVLAPLGFFAQQLLGINRSDVSASDVYVMLLFNFSLPAWVYFALGDRSKTGATLGKRLLGLSTLTERGVRVGFSRALARTAVKMVPWEIVHVSAFLFAPALGELAVGNYVGIGVSYLLMFVYLLVAWRTGGHRSVHDVVASTRVTCVQSAKRREPKG